MQNLIVYRWLLLNSDIKLNDFIMSFRTMTFTEVKNYRYIKYHFDTRYKKLR